jgi:hypothetical protein
MAVRRARAGFPHAGADPMLSWLFQPDEAFNAIVNSALVGAIDLLRAAMAEGQDEGSPEGHGAADPVRSVACP